MANSIKNSGKAIENVNAAGTRIKNEGSFRAV